MLEIERQEGRYKKPVTVYAKISCEQFQAKINELKSLDKQRVDAMQALRGAKGVITDGARYDDLNQQRIAMLWDWKYYIDGAQAAACKVIQ